MMKDYLINKYNIQGPRYTSYPTVPFWNAESFSKDKWISTFQKSFIESNEQGISLYIHLPFCESLCTFCACHKHITKRHEVEEEYIETVLEEWNLYVDLMNEKPLIKEIHLGGGTPTFFSSINLEKLIEGILKKSDLHDQYEFSFEGHPNNTTREQLQALYDLGFTRVSFGVQDYNNKVQIAINRLQSYDQVKKVTNWSREIGYTSVSHDLIFGLPFQTLDCILETINKTKSLLPDRISFYSYAHVPWIKGVGQRGFSEENLPKGEEKRKLYEEGKRLLEKLGYFEIGMDHFALKSDSLYVSSIEKKLHRNFMGYTTNETQLMVGLGMSAISDSWYSFAQNVKTTKEYIAIVKSGELPVFRGHILSKEDLTIRRHILNVMCQLSTSWEQEENYFTGIETTLELLKEMEYDGLVEINNKGLTVPLNAVAFVRNVCMSFDKYLLELKPETKLFSSTI